MTLQKILPLSLLALSLTACADMNLANVSHKLGNLTAKSAIPTAQPIELKKEQQIQELTKATKGTKTKAEVAIENSLKIDEAIAALQVLGYNKKEIEVPKVKREPEGQAERQYVFFRRHRRLLEEQDDEEENEEVEEETKTIENSETEETKIENTENLLDNNLLNQNQDLVQEYEMQKVEKLSRKRTASAPKCTQ